MHAILSRLPHHYLARHHQDFLARYGEIFARFNGRERWPQAASADDRHQHHVCIA